MLSFSLIPFFKMYDLFLSLQGTDPRNFKMPFLKATHTINKGPPAGHSQKAPRAGEPKNPAPYRGRRWGTASAAPGVWRGQPDGASPRTYVTLPELRFQALHVQSIQPSDALEVTAQHLGREGQREIECQGFRRNTTDIPPDGMTALDHGQEAAVELRRGLSYQLSRGEERVISTQVYILLPGTF